MKVQCTILLSGLAKLDENQCGLTHRNSRVANPLFFAAIQIRKSTNIRFFSCNQPFSFFFPFISLTQLKMDTVLHYADQFVFDKLYAKVWPSYTKQIAGAIVSSWPRDDFWRINLSLFLITCIFGWILYLGTATLSYYLVFDHDYMKHPKFLKNQVRMEIECAVGAIPWMTLLTLPFFTGEVLGKSMLYSGMPKNAYEWLYLAASVPSFLFFTDCGIYWFHRWMHHPLIYKHLHKLHHKWVIPTPFASHAFNPFDGFLQSLPYHLYVFMIPMNKYLYLFMFTFVNFWTVMIHDGKE